MAGRNMTLEMWTIYDHPKDYPHGFIARKRLVHPGGRVEVTDETITSAELEELRTRFEGVGFNCIARDPDDDPVIVETWL